MRRIKTSLLGDLVGEKFERWEVVGVVGNRKPRYLACRCTCGKEKEVRVDSLLVKDSRSCGCLAREAASERQKTHGHSSHKLYSTYADMCRRCYDVRRGDYKHYGGKGVSLCDSWYMDGDRETGFINFLGDMENSHLDGLEIERYDTDGNYTPDNCGWVSRKSQTNNLSRNCLITYRGLTLTSSEWGLLLGVCPKTLSDRVSRLGNIEEVLTKPFRNRKIVVIHKGKEYGTQDLMRSIGNSQGRINGIITNKAGGDSLKALDILDIPYTLVTPKYRDIPSPEDATRSFLSKVVKSQYERELADKIRKINYDF